MTRTVVVVGGGVAGLATAALLAREGHDVTLLERNARLGGRAGTLAREGFRFDTGPSWFLMPSVFEHFFSLLGTTTAEQLEMRLLDPGYRVFSEPSGGVVDAPVTVPSGRAAVRALFEQLEPGSGSQFDAYLDSANRARVMAEKYFLYNPFTRARSVLRRDILRSLPELTGLLTRSLESFAAKRFRHPVLRQILGYPAVFLGTNPKDAPALYHLMSALDLDDGVQYPSGGFWKLVERLEALARDEGVTIVTGADVVEIVCEGASSRRSLLRHRERRSVVRAVKWLDAAATPHETACDVVVSTADLHHTETTLVAEPFRSYPESWWRRQVSGPGAVLVMLGVRGELPELAHHSLFFTRDWAANFEAIFGANPRIPEPASVYVCKPSASDTSVAPKGHENLFVLVPVPADREIGSGGPDGTGAARVEATADAVIDQLAAWANVPDLRERIVVRHTIGPADFARDYNSWRGGMLGPAHILTQSALFRAQNESKRVRGLYYAGATTAPGVGLPMCLISAELVLKRIRGDHSAGPTLPRGSSSVGS